MANLHDRLAAKIPIWRDELHDLVKNHGDKVISQVTVAQALGGMRGVKGMICDTSEVPPERGLLIRGIPLADLTGHTPEDIFYLLCTGDLPGDAAREDLRAELARRARVPRYVWQVLESLPPQSHPMCMLDTAVLAMQGESRFVQAYHEGVARNELWRSMLEDCLTLLARMPTIAAGIYRLRFRKGDPIEPDPALDYSSNFAHMLGLRDLHAEAADALRLYLVLHCDHEGGNVSAHTCSLVGSALSDAYYSVSAGLNGLSGPLHGLANQECLSWVLEVRDQFGGVPTEAQLRQFAWDTLNSGRVIPGYGHAVLRVTDPRFTALLEFGKAHFPQDEIVQLVARVFEVVPKVLEEQGKAKNPWPNVDAASGAVLHHYGMTEFSYYTVMFSVSRTMGMCAQLIWNRAMGMPIERPKSVTYAWLKQQVSGA
ncbi:MAG TPA: citrate (Si)-synthase [Candidatus Krumholzibacteria bacterium]|nr:citrate (Si)-synthase [Candidatus Krumholzibacteria bacterium]HPD72427.1 citrate (Si)-synthase [Candidatus Krumholzibacteria bacterium]HRY40641.1 citrate (Si)-synthase [Candidatus Krumholzibacteria bacterium]